MPPEPVIDLSNLDMNKIYADKDQIRHSPLGRGSCGGGRL